MLETIDLINETYEKIESKDYELEKYKIISKSLKALILPHGSWIYSKELQAKGIFKNNKFYKFCFYSIYKK